VRFRPANQADIPAMMELDQRSPSAAHWSQQQYESIFSSFDSQLFERFVLVAEDTTETQRERASSGPHRMLAFMVAQRVDEDWELENIVVAENSRRRGLAIRLLSELVDHAGANQGRSIFLEVRESNQAARALYRKVGFVETGTRKSYYSNPSENAILYQLSLSHNEIAP
jgi:[ribosomal protein S18]-alanine N-acetyltransferase